MRLSYIRAMLRELNIALSVLEADLSSRPPEEFGVVWYLHKYQNFNEPFCPKCSGCKFPPVGSGAIKEERARNHPKPTFDWLE